MTDIPCFVRFFSGQVGLIQLGQEQVLLQPLNSSRGPHGGREHLLRRKWSLAPSPSAQAQAPGPLCQVLTGESGRWDDRLPFGAVARPLTHPHGVSPPAAESCELCLSLRATWLFRNEPCSSAQLF